MSKKWDELNQKFLNEHSHSGISIKAWCEINKLNYATARRYIKLSAQPNESKIHSNQNRQSAQKTLITKSNKQENQMVNKVKRETLTNKTTNKDALSKKRVASLSNQNARTFGHYSEFITTDEDAIRFNSASTTTLDDELKLTRMQLSNLMVALKMIEADLANNAIDNREEQLYETYEKLQTVANVKVARIESLENSIIRNQKTKVDIEKTIVLTEKAQLEADKLRSESNGANATLQEIYEDMLAMENDGMMNTN
jgi:hypothetical protein